MYICPSIRDKKNKVFYMCICSQLHCAAYIGKSKWIKKIEEIQTIYRTSFAPSLKLTIDEKEKNAVALLTATTFAEFLTGKDGRERDRGIVISSFGSQLSAYATKQQ